jgi:NTE family protein
MGAGGLPSAADIWSTTAEAPAPPSKPAEQPATEKPEPAETPGSIWQNSAWQKRRLAESRTWPPRRLSLALQGGGSFGAFT